MALKITDLKIDSKSLGEVLLLADITPSFEYSKDGVRSERIDGYRYSVALPEHKMEKINIKVLQKTPLIDTEKEKIPIGTPVKFTNLEVGSYYSKAQGSICITAKATDVQLVKINEAK